MRNYPKDSPRAAARIVALAALADGHMCSTEADTLDSMSISEALGLEAGEWYDVLRDYCEDVLANEPMGWSAVRPDSPMVALLLAEVEDPRLRRTVVALCAAVSHAGPHHAAGESLVLTAAAAQWGYEAPQVRYAPPGLGAVHQARIQRGGREEA